MGKPAQEKRILFCILKYTMEGDLQERNGKITKHAGIIPRAIYELFETLNNQKAEYSVRVSLIELYNEELRDLLNTSNPRCLRIYEDQASSGVIVHGMEETLITDASMGLRVLEQGSRNRSMAATRCNETSSRSHSIFTLTVRIKETQAGGEEVLKVGKLNLVDLAGSENINRSGAEYARAREAGMINQSLLTLGRVINHLVDHSTHVPYRESKLTRILKDSLGGRTKTCIIATVSVAKMNQEEIVSTLDYASRAKNIKNKPQANEQLSPKLLLQEYEMTIERLKADITAARDKKGVYMSAQSHSIMKSELQSAKGSVTELEVQLETIQMSLQEKTKQLENTAQLLLGRDNELKTITGLLYKLDNKIQLQLAESQSCQKPSDLESSIEIIKSLESNTEMMGILLKGSVQTHKEFVDKVGQVHDKLRDEIRWRNEQTESQIDAMLGDLDTDLVYILGMVKGINLKFYKEYMHDEASMLEQQGSSDAQAYDRWKSFQENIFKDMQKFQDNFVNYILFLMVLYHNGANAIIPNECFILTFQAYE
ncbi:kinesin motor protein cin8 [Apophysomyces sp. BC1034]|nr:kinesin motor protein cin8 [Apophysomyces sp. BC1021]KAG0189861.1 kinesin motor protein cin8 [Apophysomyces sp. BC1034]